MEMEGIEPSKLFAIILFICVPVLVILIYIVMNLLNSLFRKREKKKKEEDENGPKEGEDYEKRVLRRRITSEKVNIGEETEN